MPSASSGNCPAIFRDLTYKMSGSTPPCAVRAPTSSKTRRRHRDQVFRYAWRDRVSARSTRRRPHRADDAALPSAGARPEIAEDGRWLQLRRRGPRRLGRGGANGTYTAPRAPRRKASGGGRIRSGKHHAGVREAMRVSARALTRDVRQGTRPTSNDGNGGGADRGGEPSELTFPLGEGFRNAETVVGVVAVSGKTFNMTLEWSPWIYPQPRQSSNPAPHFGGAVMTVPVAIRELIKPMFLMLPVSTKASDRPLWRRSTGC